MMRCYLLICDIIIFPIIYKNAIIIIIIIIPFVLYITIGFKEIDYMLWFIVVVWRMYMYRYHGKMKERERERERNGRLF